MIDVCVPVYNEGESIKRLLDAFATEIKNEFRVLIVYDRDDDNTLPVLKQIIPSYSYEIRLVKNFYGRGVANAVKTAMQSVENSCWVLTMADLSDEPSTIDDMFLKMQEGYDMVAGSRYMRGGKKNGGPFLQSLFSRCAGLGMHVLVGLPIHDLSNAFKMYRKEVTDQIPLESTDGFEICTELVLKTYLAGYREAEVPTTWHDRTEGQSNFKMWKWIPKYLHWCFYSVKYKWFGRKPSYHRDYMKETVKEK